ncbi:hypothetical protein HK104_000032 [Borealophlyctis nickersoniae]|nr:hypothetical protein HK104_000032 [Borealophlyctis nickersoniae]
MASVISGISISSEVSDVYEGEGGRTGEDAGVEVTGSIVRVIKGGGESGGGVAEVRGGEGGGIVMVGVGDDGVMGEMGEGGGEAAREAGCLERAAEEPAFVVLRRVRTIGRGLDTRFDDEEDEAVVFAGYGLRLGGVEMRRSPEEEVVDDEKRSAAAAIRGVYVPSSLLNSESLMLVSLMV